MRAHAAEQSHALSSQLSDARGQLAASESEAYRLRARLGELERAFGALCDRTDVLREGGGVTPAAVSAAMQAHADLMHAHDALQDEYDDVEEVAASLQSQLAEAHAAERQAVAREAHVKRSREKDAFKFCSNFIQRWLSDKDLVQELSDELESVGARAEKAAALAERAAEESLVDADVARGGSGVLGVSA